MTFVTKAKRTSVFQWLTILLKVCYYLLKVGGFCAPSGIDLRKLQSIGRSHLGVTYYYRLFPSAKWSVFWSEQIDDWRQNWRRIYLKTFWFCIVAAPNVCSCQSCGSDNLSLDKNTDNMVGHKGSQKLIFKKRANFSDSEKDFPYLNMLELRISRLKNQDFSSNGARCIVIIVCHLPQLIVGLQQTAK